MNYDNVKPGIRIFDFEEFVPTLDNPEPKSRIMDYITVGPFVLETDGSFEAEHMYEREKLLFEDYLTEDGGENNIVPILGAKVKNSYYGADYYKWDKGFIKWNSLRFDREGDACDPALYATEQRNAVYYAAFYVRCTKPEKAVIAYVNSGSSLFVNGELVDFKPFGRVKGLCGLGYQCLVNLKQGINLVLFKLRPGYIADTMDISMETCCVLPVLSETNGVCITDSWATLAYVGTENKPRMVHHLFACASKNTERATLEIDGISYDIPSMKKGESTDLHIGISTDKTERIKKYKAIICTSCECNSFDMYFHTVPYDGYKGIEHVFSDFHFDTTYHQEQRTYALGAFHITKSILENLESNSDFKAILSELDYLHPYYSLYPFHRKTLKNAFETGRAESDCFYNQPNDLTSSGEAFVRNMAYGQIYHRDVLGRISRVYVPGDVFGHFSQITQVCKKGGCDMVRWGKAVLGLDNLFRHISPDGTILIHDKGIGRSDAIRFCVKGCQHSSEALSYVEAVPRYGNTSWMKKTINNVRFSVFSELADDIIKSYNENEKSNKSQNIDLTSRDLTQHHSGVLLTRTDFKQANRLCENLLVSAEKFATIAFSYGAKYPEKALDKAWRQLLCAQHHDSITGTNNEISFADLMIEYRECAETASNILKNSAEYIASYVKTDSVKESLFVFNPVVKNISGLCEFTLPDWFDSKYGVVVDIDSKEYPLYIAGRKAKFITGKIPSAGYSLYRLQQCDENPDCIIESNSNIIENRRFKLTVDKKHGGIISVFDKKLKKEIIDVTAPATGNAIYVLHEIHDRMETQHELYTTGEKLVSDDFDASIRNQKCFNYQKLIISSNLGTIARVIREIILYRDSEIIDFKTIVEDYNSTDHLFCTTFPVDVKGSAVIYDDRFAPHVSTRSKKYMSFQTHQYASFSGCRVLPANRWFGVGPSVTLNFNNGSINVGMTAIIRKNDENLISVSETLLTALTKKGIPVTPYSDIEQHGGMKIINFNEDIYETDTRFVLSVCGDKNTYADKILSKLKKSDFKKYTNDLNRYGVICVYYVDNDNLYNKPVDVFLISAVNIDKLNKYIEDICCRLSSDYKVTMNNVFCISKPERADDYGVSIINNGNISCSVEGENTLNLMLFHTASFYGNMGKTTSGAELVPEKKTHIFTYQLYPHSNSFREADVYGKSSEFNERLFAVTVDKIMDNSFLPKKYSFLESNPDFEITAFKACGYPMAALKDETLPSEKRGITVRGFETSGLSHIVKIKTGFNISDVSSTDLLEENNLSIKSNANNFSFVINPYSIETFTMFPLTKEKCDYRVLGTEKDITEPTYVRSWEHDMGSVATGNLKFAATLDKKSEKISETVENIKLNAVNNSSDSFADVTIKITCSSGIKSDRKSVRIVLKPGDCSVVPLIITRKSSEIKGQVKIQYEYDRQLFTDIYEYGYFNPEVSIRSEYHKLICTVNNNTDQFLEGSLLLATPFETWGNVINNINSYGIISPLSYHIELIPHSSAEYTFNVDIEDDNYFKAYYAVAKLCCNGRIHFAFIDRHGPRHNLWAHEFINEIRQNNGSIEKLLEM